MKKKGIQIFFLVTLGTTILFRLAGLLNLTYAHNLEFWMTGLFCGTRLFEFTAGMIFAQLFLEKKFDPWNISIKKIFTISLTIYAIGFICSLFYPTTLISNILITLGLCGLFLSFCKIINIYFPSFLKIISWIGAVSFPVFLIHQPLMLWIGNNFNGNARAAIEILVLILVLPTSYIIEITVNRTLSFLPYVKSNFKSLTILLSLFFQIILNVGFFLTGNDLIYKSDAIIFIINIFFIPLWPLWSWLTKKKYHSC